MRHLVIGHRMRYGVTYPLIGVRRYEYDNYYYEVLLRNSSNSTYYRVLLFQTGWSVCCLRLPWYLFHAIQYTIHDPVRTVLVYATAE